MTEPRSLDDFAEVLTPAETQAVLRVSRTTLWRMRRDGVITPVKVGKSLRYRKADLLRLLSGDESTD